MTHQHEKQEIQRVILCRTESDSVGHEAVLRISEVLSWSQGEQIQRVTLLKLDSADLFVSTDAIVLTSRLKCYTLNCAVQGNDGK